jgi:hypothetical protein
VVAQQKVKGFHGAEAGGTKEQRSWPAPCTMQQTAKQHCWLSCLVRLPLLPPLPPMLK